MIEKVVFVPLHITSSTDDKNEVNITLLGKTQEGKETKCIVIGFYPYFYIGPVPILEPSKISILERTKDVKGIERVEKTNIYGYTNDKQTYLKVSYKHSKNVTAVKTEIETKLTRILTDRIVTNENKSTKAIDDLKVFETNIGFITRFMVDKGIVGMGYVEVSGTIGDDNGTIYASAENVQPRNEITRLPPLKILSFDLECIGKENKFPVAQEDPVVQIGNAVAYYLHSEIKERVLFSLGTCNSIPGVTIHTFTSEIEMLTAWSEWVKKVNPDVLTGYNTTGFDIPYLLERAKVLGLNTFRYFSRTKEEVSIRSQVSMTNSFGTKETKVVSVPGRLVFDMLDIVRKEFNLHSYSLNTVSSIFLNEQKEDVHYTEISALYNGNPETRKRLGVYCMKDSYLPLKILFTKNLFVNYCELARVTGVPFEYLVNRGQGIRVLSQLLRKAKENNYILPVIMGEAEGYQGGHVMDPEKGFYTDPIAVLDFASLYPSIIMAYNLCYTTLIEKGAEKNMSKDSYVVSPTGDCFVHPRIRAGLLPSILINLLQNRKNARQELAKEKDLEMKMTLNARQLALKISANSVYGFTGASKTGLPCIPISRSVTSFGREILLKTKSFVEDQFRPTQEYPLRVIYGDTDSVMVTAGEISLENMFKVGDKISKYVTDLLPDPLTLEFEKVYQPFLLMNKKRYAGCTHTSPEDPGRIDTKGIETVRRDNCQLVRDLMKDSLSLIFLKNDTEAVRALIKQTVKELLLNKIGIGRLIISKSISKDEKAYASKQPHTELAIRMKKRNNGPAPVVGDRISYVIVKGDSKLNISDRSEDPLYALEHNLPIDTEYYLHHQLTSPLTRLLEPILPDIHSLLAPSSIVQPPKELSKKGLGQFFTKKKHCLVCHKGTHPICTMCQSNYHLNILSLSVQLSLLQYKYHTLYSECLCIQHSHHRPIICCNRDCPIVYLRKELSSEICALQQKYTSLLSLSDANSS
ncbi:DNA polymerase delta subunit 1 [Nematocida sp. AWRm80]|nr:DNA polymerase delta subunit 1 [Nematocida sp. AWRm80]